MTVRDRMRDGLVWLAVIVMAPLWCWAALEKQLGLGEGIFTACSELLSLVPGKPGIFARRAFYRMTLDACSTDCQIGFGTTFSHPTARVGHGVMIGNRCTVGSAVIENDVTIGSNVDILSGRRQHSFEHLDQPIQRQGGRFTSVNLGRNSWIGNSTVVMADIGADCVIGAGAVIVKPIPSRSVAVGNPAEVKKVRT